MGKQKSFSRIEQNVRHGYRNSLNTADSTEDVKKSFVYAVQDFIEDAFEGRVTVNFDDVWLDQDAKDGFVLSVALLKNKDFAKALDSSDIPSILARLAESALNRIKHLEEKHPDKTEAKMYPTPSHAGKFFSNPPIKKRL